jgi:FkbM family methyltransferase
VSLTGRILGAASRRLDRPELLAAVYPAVRQAQRDETAIRALLAAALPDGAVYVDVGANLGQVLAEAVRVSPHGEHIAFEPIPRVAAELAERFPSVDCRRLAVGAAAGEAEFCHFRKLEGWSGLRRSPEISDERGDPEYITVTVSTLDAELDGRDPRVVKIDVEGAELEVLEGGRALLERTRPLVVFEHVAAAAALYGSRSEAIWDLFAELGYEVLTVTGDGPLSRERFAAAETVVNWLARPQLVTSSVKGAPAVVA